MSRNSQLRRRSKRKKINKKDNILKEKEQREKRKIPTIYFDESGNTGANLLDSNQPVFTLASCNFTDEESKKLVDLLDSKSPGEAHFSRLRRRKAGQDGIVRLMGSKLLTTKKIGINVFLKEFMIATKVVDVLIEHMMHLDGEDLYLNGRNIALSNMLYICLPHNCAPELVQEMYTNFVSMIRNPEEVLIDQFYDSVERVLVAVESETIRPYLKYITRSKEHIETIISGNDRFSLDPSIPAFFAQCVHWGLSYQRGFHVVHDDSQSLERQQTLFAKFMDWTKNDVELGYDRRKFTLPLKCKTMKFADSENHLQLQVADVVASSFAYWAAGISKGEKNDYLFLELDRLGLDKYIGNSKIWPTTDVSPVDLGTVHNGGLNAADYTAEFLINATPDLS